MELTQTQHGLLLEELLLASKGDNYWAAFHGGVGGGGGDCQIFPTNWNSELFDHHQDLAASNSSVLGLVSAAETEPVESGYAFPLSDKFPYGFDGLAIPSEFDSSSFEYHCKQFHNLPPIPFQEDAQLGLFGIASNGFCEVEKGQLVSKMESGGDQEQKNEAKKTAVTERQPSKNLMAERRRRKRLNDRLSMLRSIVPRISKMDRTSILGGTIDYMKDLLDKIQKLREESMEEDMNQMNKMGNTMKEPKPDEVLAAGNPPKFEVERRSRDTQIELRCTSKPGLLLSTVSTMEALGLDIQQCVISCFNDFSLQATCSEVAEHRRIIGSEDVKQALFRNAGYGGRCL